MIGRSNPSPNTTIVRIERMLVHIKFRGTGDDNLLLGTNPITEARRVLNGIRRPRLLVLSSQDMVFGVSNDHLGKRLQTFYWKSWIFLEPKKNRIITERYCTHRLTLCPVHIQFWYMNCSTWLLELSNISNVDPARWFIVVRIVLPPCHVVT